VSFAGVEASIASFIRLGQNLDVRLGVLVIAKREEVVEVGAGEDHADVLERLGQPVDDLLVDAGRIQSLRRTGRPLRMALFQMSMHDALQPSDAGS
jgi:hypothetical protein